MPGRLDEAVGAGDDPVPGDELLAGLSQRCVWPDGEKVNLAVSGGADSLALLLLARHTGLDAVAIHVDHGLRPGSAAEADVVAAAAAACGAGFRSLRVEVAAGSNVEARARAARYSVLPVGVLTGHTADDQAETILLNLARGAGIDGLAAMATPGAVRHPILAIRRAETHALCAATGLDPVVDPTNEHLDLRRNAVRHRLLPLLAEVAGRDPVPVLARQAALLADDAAYLDEAAAGVDPTDARALVAAPLPVARRALRRWLRETAGPERHPPSAAEVARVLGVAAGGAVACEVSLGRRVARRQGRLRVETAPDEPGRAGQ